MWKKGDYILERIWLALPDLDPGMYSLGIIIFDNRTGVPENLHSKGERSLDRITAILQQVDIIK